MSDEIKKIPIFKILNQALTYIKQNKLAFGLCSLINFLFLLTFLLIDGGLSNKISIIWFIAYYAFWCAFFRFYYNKKPYLLTCDIFGSLIPSTKMFFLVVAMSVLLGLLPYLPLLMGFDDKYLLLFEKYMQQLQEAPANTLNMLVLSSILILLFPFILCRPFLAFIASVQGLNGSIRKAWRKSIGNYWQFVSIIVIINIPCIIIYEADKLLGCSNYLNLICSSVLFVYYNLVFAKIYDFFYSD